MVARATPIRKNSQTALDDFFFGGRGCGEIEARFLVHQIAPDLAGAVFYGLDTTTQT